MIGGGNQSQLDAGLKRAEIIRASAGSGKTFVLVQRYLALLVCGESPKSILASTFTVKAAGEIQRRVFFNLAQAVTSDEVRTQLGADVGRSISKSQMEGIFQRALREFPSAAICTLDGLVSRIAGALTVECGLPLGWRMSENPGLQRDLERELVSLQARELGKLLSIIVRSDASRKIADPLISACLRFYERLQLHGHEAFRLGNRTAETMPIKQWEQWSEELAQMPLPLTKAQTPRARFATAVSELNTQLKQKNFVDLFQSTIIQRALERGSYDSQDLKAEVYLPLWQLAKQLRNFEWNRIAERNEVLLMVLANFDKLYQQHLHQSGLVTHSDLLLAVARFMAEDKLSGVAYALDQRFSHILLDEFQDTSPLQWQVLNPLVAEIVGDESRNRTAFIVGDPKQAIYGWRGGSSAIFAEVTQSVQAQWSERSLVKSYRSSPVVLEFINKVFGGLNVVEQEFQQVAQDFKRNFEKHQSVKSNNGRVTITQTIDDCGSWVASKVAEIFAAAPNARIGILTRRNDTVNELVQALRHSGVSVVGDGKAGADRTLPVEAVKKLLYGHLHPADSVARFLVRNSGLLQSDEDLEVVIRESCTPKLISRLVKFAERGELTLEQYNDLQLAIAALSSGMERGADARELIMSLQNQPLSGGQAQVTVMTMHRAKGLEFEYVLLPELNTRLIRQVSPDALAWVDDSGQYRILPYISEALRNVDQRFVKADAQMRQQEVLEALCLLYVALTRSVTELHLFSPYTGKTEYPFSMFGVVAASLGLDIATQGVIFDTSV